MRVGRDKICVGEDILNLPCGAVVFFVIHQRSVLLWCHKSGPKSTNKGFFHAVINVEHGHAARLAVVVSHYRRLIFERSFRNEGDSWQVKNLTRRFAST